jgi:hypothetical protein
MMARVRFANALEDRKWHLWGANVLAPIFLLVFDLPWYADLMCLVLTQGIGLLSAYQLSVGGDGQNGRDKLVPASFHDPKKLRGQVLFWLPLIWAALIDLAVLLDLSWTYVGIVTCVAVLSVLAAYLACRLFKEELSANGLSW